ncbi:MAG: NAD(P)H-hydrate dehydratase [Chryseolinea sp.]
MQKILSSKQVRELDAYTIEQNGIESIDLMERACRSFFNWFVSKFQDRRTVGIVCGNGNNGGDGAGIARMLKERGYDVTLWLVESTGSASGNFKINLEKAKSNKLRIYEILDRGEDTSIFRSCDIIVDALFGSGLNRPVTGLSKWVIDCMNAAAVTRVAVDVPSGLMADGPSEGSIVLADHTVSFQVPKLSFFLPECYRYVGAWTLVDIGLDKDFMKSAETRYQYVTLKSARRLLRRRSKFDHKGIYGHALMIAGSLGKLGAAVLSSRAALRSGLGLLTIHIPKCGNIVLQSSVPEAMVSLDRNEEVFASPPALDSFSVIGIGPGIGKATDTVKALRVVLENFRRPIVIDADALNIISEHQDLMQIIPPGSILTPHPKEFERLVGRWSNDFERLSKQRDLAIRLKSVVLVKGAFTAIADSQGNIFFNTTGNPGMATGGSGDVLTGILTGLLAQKYESIAAAVLGVYLHGLSGDIVASERGMNGLLASDIIKFLHKAFQQLRRD